MDQTTTRSAPLGERPWFKYGMLGFILLLGLFNVVVYAEVRPGERSGAVANLIVWAMLLVNHVCGSFLTERGKRIMVVPQFLVIAGGLLYLIAAYRR